MELPTGITFVAGFLLQWLRSRSWFEDWMALLVAVVLAGVAVWLLSPETDLKKAALEVVNLVPTVLGGTLVASMASHLTPVVPKTTRNPSKGGK